MVSLHKPALNASLHFGAMRMFGLCFVAALQLAVEVAVFRGGGGLVVGALHGHPEQRFVALRIAVDRRDHYQHVGGRRGRTAATAIVGRRCSRIMMMVIRCIGLLQVPRGPVHH